MTVEDFLRVLREEPLIVSVQASEGSPLDDTETLAKLARASVSQGIHVLRLEGYERVAKIPASLDVVTIGLIKRRYGGSQVYITPTEREVEELLATGCEVIALDATPRPRPSASFADLVRRIQAADVLAMADCDSLESATFALDAGADILSTTLSGYTGNSGSDGPDLELLRSIVKRTRVPVLAEGRFSRRDQVEAALRIGATGVVVGGAINDPVKTTRQLRPSPRLGGTVGAFDIGGTWMRYAVYSPDWDLLEVEREPLAHNRAERHDWMRRMVESSEVVACGISSGGTIDPATNEVWEAKPIIPELQGTQFQFGVPTTALNDGLATAWGHACLPDYAGKRVATLALGTGVGCGFVASGQIWMGPRGEYARINDLPMGAATFESLLGGAALSPRPDPEQRIQAIEALRHAVSIIRATMFADEIVICGSVGLSGWIQPQLAELGLRVTPFGPDAGLFGAAALVLYPPNR